MIWWSPVPTDTYSATQVLACQAPVVRNTILAIAKVLSDVVLEKKKKESG